MIPALSTAKPPAAPNHFRTTPLDVFPRSRLQGHILTAWIIFIIKKFLFLPKSIFGVKEWVHFFGANSCRRHAFLPRSLSPALCLKRRLAFSIGDPYPRSSGEVCSQHGSNLTGALGPIYCPKCASIRSPVVAFAPNAFPYFYNYDLYIFPLCLFLLLSDTLYCTSTTKGSNLSGSQQCPFSRLLQLLVGLAFKASDLPRWEGASGFFFWVWLKGRFFSSKWVGNNWTFFWESPRGGGIPPGGGGKLCGPHCSPWHRIFPRNLIFPHFPAFPRIFPHGFRIFLPCFAEIDRVFLSALEDYAVRIFFSRTIDLISASSHFSA